MTNEEYVKSKWEKVHYVESRGYSPYSCGIVYCKAPYGESSEWLLSGPLDLPKAAAWRAAADFTDTREEEIRQLGAEVARLEGQANCGLIRILKIVIPNPHYQSFVCEQVIDLYRDCRILAARQSALDEMKRGWRG